MSKLQTQIIQTEYGVYVPKPYNPVTERMVATAPSIIERAFAALKTIFAPVDHKKAGVVMTHHATPAK